MTITTAQIGAAVTPTVIKTYITHYTDRKSRHQRPTAHISYDEGLHLIRAFLEYTSHRTVEELQTFTAKSVPHPRWVKVDTVTIPAEQISKAADVLIEQLGPKGIDKIGGSRWWQWRQKGVELRADWVEMRAYYNERERLNQKCNRVMLYVHGGGYFFGSVDEHRYQMQRHARKLKARVFAPRYRLAPQFPFPCGLQDCLAAYLFLLTVQDPSEIILAGDSAGGGMIVSIMCLLRDQGLPLPAGGVLISPWVDTTHSFPSLAGDDSLDYIPARGFMAKPSAAWPPPNEEEILAIAKGAVGKAAAAALPRHSNHRERKLAEAESEQGFAVVEKNVNADAGAKESPNNPAKPGDADEEVRAGNTIPGPGHQLSIELDGQMVKLIDQIQMYTTNQLLSHPLVSPVLQPSLGGLPPLLVMTGGGEILRDEQIYLAHKAANPTKYRLGDAYHAEYDPKDEILERWSKPTPVQLQVWDDLCHVAPTLSFTRPAKFMYRSIAQFGAWALARAQKKGMEIMDDDNISVISSGSDTDTDSDGRKSTDSVAKQKHSAQETARATQVGRAGDPLPAFKNHMIRQRVDRHGMVYALAPETDLPALQMNKNDIGVIKAAPVRKWMIGKKEWDGKYAKIKRKVQKQRIKEMSAGYSGFGSGESPPPSALAGRRGGNMEKEEKARKQKKSLGLMMWSGWGSKHDESTLQREESAGAATIGKERTRASSSASATEKGVKAEERVLGRRISSTSTLPPTTNERKRSVSRRRTVTVIDEGQVEGIGPNAHSQEPTTEHMRDVPYQQRQERDDAATGSAHLTPFYMPKFKSKHKDTVSHLRNESKDDASSVRTGYSAGTTGAGVDGDNMSTTAVFAAPVVMKSRERKATNASSLLANDVVNADDPDALRSDTVSIAGTKRTGGGGGMDTPASRRSVERLESHQVEPEEKFSRLHAIRSPSTVAVVGAPGVVGEFDVDDGEAGSHAMRPLEQSVPVKETASNPDRKGEEVDRDQVAETHRPGMYDRTTTEFQTAVEKF